MDRSTVNKVLGSFMLRLDMANPELAELLARFGWLVPEGSFAAPWLDVRGLQAALQRYLYVKGRRIGSGAYGQVFVAKHRETGELNALKQVRLTERGLCEATLREISTLRELNHVNIVKLRDVIVSKYCYLILELLDSDLYTLLYSYGAWDLTRIKSVMFQVLSGLHHAHCHSVLHRDLKPQNILVGMRSASDYQPSQPPADQPAPAGANGSGSNSHTDKAQHAASRTRLVVKIADFGLSRPYLPSSGVEIGAAAYTNWVVTLYYRAPELLLGTSHYGPAVDIWAAGCVLAELLNRAPLFRSDCEIGVLRDMFAKLGTPPPDLGAELPGLAEFGAGLPRTAPVPWAQLVPRLASDPAGADLLSRMLSYDPRRRISASQALQHPWFDDVRAEELAAAREFSVSTAAAATATAAAASRLY